MPVYEYACAACSHQFEEWQKMSDPPIRSCPKCRAKKVEKLISLTSFSLKGGGWYKDLYSSAKPGSTAAESGGDQGGGDKPGKADKAGEAKSDASAKSDGGAKSAAATKPAPGGKAAKSSSKGGSKASAAA